MKNIKTIYLIIISFTILTACSSNTKNKGPYFGNGFHNGWADQNSIVIWTRLTKTPELNANGQKFLDIDHGTYRQIEVTASDETFLQGQIPEGFTLDQMEGACPGNIGEVKLLYYPMENPDNKTEIGWMPVDIDKNFTKQWKLEDLQAGAKYKIELFARYDDKSSISDTITGFFQLPAPANSIVSADFCVVTGHDYPRRDDSINGHKIYKEMLDLQPDFYVHTGDIEYYDKPLPYAFTEELMRFKWDRLFALPFQRNFYRQVTTYFIKDDHDVLSNDSNPGMTYGNVTFERGLEIFDMEQFPTSDKPYKTVRWGKDLQVWIVDGRNYRSKNKMPDSKEKTIWGKEQKEWFFRTIKESDATFKVLISATPVLGPDRTNKNDNHANEGFKYEGDEIRAFINQFENVYICTGDRHWQYVSHIENTNLWEFSCGPGSDEHAGGWNQENLQPEHKFLRVKGGFLKGAVYRENDVPVLKFQHFDTEGNIVNEKVFKNLE
ncbi:MAG: alkaline phosphatase D family protein [Bacteroidales bacterium]|nr:alkaline phosphatase D family protein [Bacteroidales bacterium]